MQSTAPSLCIIIVMMMNFDVKIGKGIYMHNQLFTSSVAFLLAARH